MKADGEIASLDSSMGLLALLEPHFKEARQELTRLRVAVNKLTDTSKPTIFCEGPSDKTLFTEALQLFYRSKAPQVDVRCSSHHGGGYTWVSEMLIAWSFSRPTAIAVGIFDKDEDAIRSKAETEKKLNVPSSGKKAFSMTLIPGAELKECFLRKVPVPFGPEELFPSDVWDMMEHRGWLEDRSNPLLLYKYSARDVSFDLYFKEVLPEVHLLRVALKKVKRENKEALAKYVTNLKEVPERQRVLLGFKPTLERCLKLLGLVK